MTAMKPAFRLEELLTELGQTFTREEEGGRWSDSCPECGGDVLVRDSGDAHCDDCSTDAAHMLRALGEGGVVVPLPRDIDTTTPLAYGRRPRMKDMIRVVDMADILSRPEEPIRWAIDGFAQRGALTVLAARGGTGKSWVGIEACAAVQSGRSFVGLDVEQGTAAYVDGEMGERQMAGRFRAGGLDADAFTVLDAVGLDLGNEDGCAALESNLSDLRVSFVVVDSLRRLTPGRKESDSDDMAPVLGRLAVMAKRLDLAMVVIHHGGWNGERAYRGSTAIGDQADAVLALERDGDALRLFCDPDRGCKMRGAQEPEPRWMRLAIGGAERGVVVISAPTPSATTTGGKATAAERIKRDLVALFAGVERPIRKPDAAAGLSVAADNKNFRLAWGELVREGALTETPAGFSLAENVAHEVAA